MKKYMDASMTLKLRIDKKFTFGIFTSSESVY
jgi:hypothetical protein